MASFHPVVQLTRRDLPRRVFLFFFFVFFFSFVCIGFNPCVANRAWSHKKRGHTLERTRDILQERFARGPSAVTTQLVVAMADLIAYVVQWEDPIGDLLNTFGYGIVNCNAQNLDLCPA